MLFNKSNRLIVLSCKYGFISTFHTGHIIWVHNLNAFKIKKEKCFI